MDSVGAYVVTLDADTTLTVPAEVRERHGWRPGDSLIAIETDHGLLLATPSDALTSLRHSLAGRDLVAELLAERRQEAEGEAVPPGAPTIAP